MWNPSPLLPVNHITLIYPSPLKKTTALSHNLTSPSYDMILAGYLRLYPQCNNGGRGISIIANKHCVTTTCFYLYNNLQISPVVVVGVGRRVSIYNIYLNTMKKQNMLWYYRTFVQYNIILVVAATMIVS